MKKKLLGIISIGLLLVIVGCKVRVPSPEESTRHFIEGLVYGGEKEEVEEYVDCPKGLPSYEDEIEKMFKEKLPNGSKKQLDELTEKLQTKIKKKTSCEVKALKEGRKQASVEVTVIGLNLFTDEDITRVMNEQFEKVKAKLSATTSEKEATELENQLIYDSLDQLIDEIIVSENPQKITLNMKLDKKNKNKWKIVQEKEFVEKLFSAVIQ